MTRKIFFLLALFFIFRASVINAQEMKDLMKDLMKERIRESLSTPDMSPLQPPPLQTGPQRQREEVLKVSPTTRLPTRFDRFIITPKPEEMKIRMTIIPTNSSPINMRLIGSTEVLIGKPKDVHANPGMHPAPGMLVVPSGINFDPTYRREERRRERTDRLIRAYNNDW